MDMSFADQALSCEYMVKNHKSLEKKVYTVPVDIDKRVAKLKLESMGIKIDSLTPGAGRVSGQLERRHLETVLSSQVLGAAQLGRLFCFVPRSSFSCLCR